MLKFQSSDSDDPTSEVAIGRRTRSAALTPAELEILAATADMPKPKRHRKHRKKNKKENEAKERVRLLCYFLLSIQYIHVPVCFSKRKVVLRRRDRMSHH